VDDGRGTGTDAERAELAALRRRAYAPDADIHSDPAALARLTELEGRALQERSPVVEPDADIPAAAQAMPAETTPVPVPAEAPPAPGGRRRAVVVVSFGVLGLAVGAALLSGLPIGDGSMDAVGGLEPGEGAPAASSPAPEAQALDLLRRAVLVGAEPDNVAGRVIRDELEGYGEAHGWSVWAGPTIDDAFCLVIGRGDPPTITCGAPEYVAAHGLSLVVPAVTGGPAVGGEAAVEPGQPVRITLLPGGAGIESEPDH